MSFSFVSRITEIEPGRWARGVYLPPATPAVVPRWLVAEAIGQLAGWVAMANCGFRRRLVAAIVGLVDLGDDTAPGEALALEVEVRPREETTVTYGGRAESGGCMITELGRCVAPMLPMAEFDDPAVVRERFETLRAGGVGPEAFDDPFDHLRIELLEQEDAECLGARLTIPESAPFFADHFPRRPVFPATLLNETGVRVALDLAQRVVGGDPAALATRCVRHVKVRAFSPPGQVLLFTARVRSVTASAIDLAVSARSEERLVATAQVEVGRTEQR